MVRDKFSLGYSHRLALPELVCMVEMAEEEQGLQFLKDRELCRLLVRKTK